VVSSTSGETWIVPDTASSSPCRGSAMSSSF